MALHLLGRLCTGSNGPLPSIVSFNAAISACEKGERWELAVWLLVQVLAARGIARQAGPADITTFNAAISACEKGARWTLAIHILRHMLQLRLHPGLPGCSAALSACGRAGRWVWALKLFGHLRDIQPSLDLAACNAALSAFEKGSQWSRALALLNDLGHSGMPVPDTVQSELIRTRWAV